jgi:hypothetical protein
MFTVAAWVLLGAGAASATDCSMMSPLACQRQREMDRYQREYEARERRDQQERRAAESEWRRNQGGSSPYGSQGQYGSPPPRRGVYGGI